MDQETHDGGRADYLIQQRRFDRFCRDSPIYSFFLRVIADDNLAPKAAAQEFVSTQALLCSQALWSRWDHAVDEAAIRTDRKGREKLAQVLLEAYNLTKGDPSHPELSPENWEGYAIGEMDISTAWAGWVDPYDDPEVARHWENTFAFMAALTGAAYADDPAAHQNPDRFATQYNYLDMCGKGLITLWAAFGLLNEDGREPPIQSEHATRVACWFLLLGGRSFWAKCKADYVHWPRSRRESPMWDLGGWRHWKEGIVEAQSRDFSDDTKRLLQETLAEMDRIDADDAPDRGGKWW